MTIRHRLMLLLTVLGVITSLTVVVAAGAHAGEPNADCTLLVPAAPLTAAGLTTPYQLTASDADDGPCNEANPLQAAFVEAAILNPATGALSLYHPLVVDKATTPASPPAPLTLPAGAVVGIWFGANGDTLRLAGDGATGAVTGLHGSVFGQFSYINAPTFFAAAQQAIAAGTLVIPPLGTANDGKPCPTTRDFMVVDQDQSDNVGTAYWVTTDGTMSQVPAAGAVKMPNGSDEGLLANRIDPALGCIPWLLPSLDGLPDSPSLAANELMANAQQATPAALTPLNDPMALLDGHFSVRKTNLYRAGVDQRPFPAGQYPQQYCWDLQRTAPARFQANRVALTAAASPDAGVTLYDFLTARLANSLVELGCRTMPPVPQHHRHHGHHHRGRDD